MSTPQIKLTCCKCRTTFILGVNGILYEDCKPTCDKCGLIQRATNGFILFEDTMVVDFGYLKEVK